MTPRATKVQMHPFLYTKRRSHHHIPPILSMTDPSNRPAQVSNTKTLLPAWMFARVNIWASVSYLRWLRHRKTHAWRHTSAPLRSAPSGDKPLR